MATAVEPHESHEDGHDDWHHQPFSAHHFENAEQQFDSGKLGMWLFLVTEILFFSGLFCAYAVYRSTHPEVFIYASQFLDKYLGGMNTIVLIFSSLTMAWAVRCAQLGQRNGLVTLLGVTLFCAALFLGVKTFEYTEKAHKRLLWSGAFVNSTDIGKSEGQQVFRVGEPLPKAEFEDRVMASLVTIQKFWLIPGVIAFLLIGIGFGTGNRPLRTTGIAGIISVIGILAGIWISIEIHHAQHGGDHAEGHGDSHAVAEHEDDHAEEGHGDHDHAPTAEEKEAAEIDAEALAIQEKTGIEATEAPDSILGEMNDAIPAISTPVDTTPDPNAPRNANLFFSIYYFMTGLHAFHIICGMIAITWLMVRSVENHFRPDYFGPVDFVGLYWHIVDLIWIYLFPLLYLIGH